MSEPVEQNEALFLDPPPGRHRYVGRASEECRRCGRGPLIPEHLILSSGYGILAYSIRDEELDALPHWGCEAVKPDCCEHFVHQHADGAAYAIDPDDGTYQIGVRPCMRCDCRRLR